MPRPLILFLLCLGALSAQRFNPTPSVPASQFPIMPWGGSPTEPEHLRLMKQAGLNLSGFCRVEDLDAVRDAGLQCIVSDPAISAVVHKNQATDAEIQKAVDALAARIKDHPAVFGVNLRDEPGVDQMPILGRLSAALLKALPGKLPYVNLFPNYANRQQLGANTYEDYLRAYIKHVPLPYLSWDNYSLTAGEMHPRFFDNLEAVRKVTLETGIPFWNCILSTALFRHMEPSDATLSLQVYSTLAYGGRGIQYFTYFSADVGNFRLAPIDHYGNRTATWDALRRVNNQLLTLLPTILKLRSTGVYHWPVSTAAGTPLLKDIRTSAELLVGEFTDDAGRPYVLLVNKNLSESFNFNPVPWKSGATFYRVSPVTGKESPFGGESVWLAPGSGMLLRLADTGSGQ